MKISKTKYISEDELRNRLSISRNKAYELAHGGSLETVKIGRSLRISEESVGRWLDSLSVPEDRGDELE